MSEEFSIMGIIVDEIEDIFMTITQVLCYSILKLYMLMDTSH